MKNLYFFPCFPDNQSGYGIAVSADILSFNCTDEDYYVFISDGNSNRIPFSNSLIIKRNNLLFRFSNLISRGHPGFFSSLYIFVIFILKFRMRTFNKVVIGDINYYGLHKYFISDNVTVRLHNLYLKMNDNLKWRLFDKSLVKLRYEIFVGARIELRLIKCSKVRQMELICITAEEASFLRNRFKVNSTVLGIYNDSVLSKVNSEEKELKWDGQIVWFGGLSSHKLYCMNVFIREIYPLIRANNPKVQLMLFGKGTERINSRINKIFGHGYTEDFNFKRFSNAVFINPDVIGGGVKLKLLTLREMNVVFLTTELGIEGFNRESLGNKCFVGHLEDWPKIFMSFKTI